ncbi:hypothetical protein BsWGS_15716 [Bradybaena similaris]
MSIVFVPAYQRSGEPDSHCTREIVQKMLEENEQLIKTISGYQLKGRMTECVEYQKVLHRNIVYLAKLADLSSSGQVSLPSHGTQTSNVSESHVTQVHSAGQGGLNTVSNQGCQQGSAQIQGPSTTDDQSFASLNQPLMSAEHPGNFRQMSQACSDQSSSLMMPQQQLMMSQDQSVLLHHSTTMANGSYSLTSLHASNQKIVIQSLNHQEEYHNLVAGQQEYTPQQQFSGHLVEIPQYTQLLPSSSTQQNPCMSNQQIQESPQSYVPYNSQRIMNSEGSSCQQQSSIGGAENQTGETGQQGSVSNSVRELTGHLNPTQMNMSSGSSVTHYDMPNLTNV